MIALAEMMEREMPMDSGERQSLAAQFAKPAEAASDDQVEPGVNDLNDELGTSNQDSIANDDLETFSYSVAHDLRSPIRQIAAFSKILVEEYGPQLPPEARRYLEKIDAGANELGRRVDGLLHVVRIGKQALSLQIASLDSILSQALESLLLDCTAPNIDWRIAELCTIECDQRLMKLAVINLLENAIKYTQLRHDAVIEVGIKRVNGETIVFVRDNGVGFDMRYADKLFGLFQRLHSTKEFSGIGVGLATAERIIRKHGGRMWAQAVPNRGATFYFTVNACIRPQPIAPTQE